MRTTATLIATLMLGVASCAYAQGGPSEGLGGGAGPGGGAIGIGGGAPGGDGPRGGGPGGDGPSGGAPSMEQGPAGDGGRESGGPSADGTTTRGETGDGKASRAERRANDDGGGKGRTERSARRDKSEKSEVKADDTASSDKADKPDRAGKDAAAQGVKDAQDAAAKKDADPARAERAERVKHVDLSGGKRDRVQSAFRDKPDIKRRTDVDIDISVGRRMPRDWHFAPVPITVIELVPEYRDYVFVYVEDEYVICDPDTYEVVAVVPAGGGGSYARAGDASCSTRIRLDEDQRELILKSVRIGREVDVADLEVGWSVPGDIELREFPSEVLSEADELSGCRYFIADDELAVVDPEEDKVVLLIDKR